MLFPVKGVNFYGPRSEFVVSGSDCGNIFFWDKDTESIVHMVHGDKEGVVSRFFCGRTLLSISIQGILKGEVSLYC
jgi:hypothetical protein